MNNFYLNSIQKKIQSKNVKVKNWIIKFFSTYFQFTENFNNKIQKTISITGSDACFYYVYFVVCDIILSLSVKLFLTVT